MLSVVSDRVQIAFLTQLGSFFFSFLNSERVPRLQEKVDMNLQKKGKKAFHQLGSLLKKRINKKKL